jgi:hypothetical protein
MRLSGSRKEPANSAPKRVNRAFLGHALGGGSMELANTQPTFDVHMPERAVFVTDDNRRARRLRRGALVAATFACLWLVGLGVGMLGLGGLPGISLGKHLSDGAGQAPPAPSTDTPSPVARSLDSRQLLGPVAAPNHKNQRRLGSQSRSARAPARPAPPASKPVSSPGLPQQPVNPAGRQRGWSRKGSQAPPGQVRKTQPPPPPGSRGQHRGQNQTTTKPVPPGQAKKTPPPPEG